MIIRKYADIPLTYAPDKGEVVRARVSASDRYATAVVLHAGRWSRGLRIKVQWLDGPRQDKISWIRVPGSRWPQLIQRIPKGQPPAS